MYFIFTAHVGGRSGNGKNIKRDQTSTKKKNNFARESRRKRTTFDDPRAQLTPIYTYYYI